jgi:NitT/TauT family transport system substrate-binding protein
MTRKIVLLLLSLLAFAPSGEARERVVLQLKWLPQAQFAGYYVAQAKGFYRQQGLDVTIEPGGPDLAPARALASGKADVAVDWLASALNARENGMPLVNIAQIFQRSGLELTCERDSGVRIPADLKGKTLAAWFGGNQFPFFAWMAKLGYSTTGPHPDVRVLHQGTGVELLTGRTAACISTMSYNEYWQVIDAGVSPADLVVFRYQDEGVATLEDGLYALGPRLADGAFRARLARFLRASIMGWSYALRHPRETVTIVLEAGDGKLDRRRQARMLREVARLVADGKHGIGYLAPADYRRTVEVLLSGKGNRVIHREPRGAWTHQIWNLAEAKRD